MFCEINQKTRTIDQHFAENFEKLNIPMHAGGADIYIEKSQKVRYEGIFQNISKSYHNLYIFKQLASLKNIGIPNSFVNTFSTFSRKLPIQGGCILYVAWQGKIYITELQIQTDYKYAQGARNIPAGVYKVSKTDVSEKPWSAADKNEVVSNALHVNTKNLAINGICKDIQDAANYMPSFITYGHGESALDQSYSLFFNPSYGGLGSNFHSMRDGLSIMGGSQVARKLTSTLEHLGKTDQKVNLTVHESGHDLLKHALRQAKNNGQTLNNITVFYANPLSNLQVIDNLRKQAGMQLAKKPPLINSLNISQYLTSGNLISQPVVSSRADSSNGFASFYNSTKGALSLVALGSIGGSALGIAGWALSALPVAIGQSRELNKQVISNDGEAVKAGAKHYKKMIWDPIHKMMVRG